jgi:arginyl-tRNA synthetase
MLDLLTAPIAAHLAKHLGVAESAVAALLMPPAKGVAADLALPCFQLAKAKGVPPPALANEIAGVLSNAGLGVQAVAAGPFCNLTFTTAGVAAALLPTLAKDGKAALRSNVGAGKTVCIDFSSPNIAKHLAFHHIRSTMIGNALAHCYAAAGWSVKRINFLGDWGTAFGRLIAGWKREGLTLAQLDAASDRVTFLNELYVRISNAAKEDKAVEEEARTWSKRLEDGDAEARSLWQIFKDASLKEFERVYGLLGVTFDSWKGEAYYEDKMGPVLAELESKGLTKIDQGATIIDLTAQGIKTPVLLKRADGGTLYATRDLAAADDRFKDFSFDRSLYVVDLGQGLHFKQWFAVAKLLGRPYADRLKHIGFGIVLMWNDEPGEGLEPGWARGRTRGGKVMLLREVLEEAIDRARAVIAEKNAEIVGDERERIAAAVGVGAVVFNDLKNGRTGDVKFKFEEALRFDGETGPYLQFAHARLCSIERKFAEAHPSAPAADVTKLTRPDEKAVLLAIARLRLALEKAVETDEPSALASGLLALAGEVASWLTAGNHDHDARVLCADAGVSTARLALVRAARGSLGEGLRLMGLRAPHRM